MSCHLIIAHAYELLFTSSSSESEWASWWNHGNALLYEIFTNLLFAGFIRIQSRPCANDMRALCSFIFIYLHVQSFQIVLSAISIKSWYIHGIHWKRLTCLQLCEREEMEQLFETNKQSNNTLLNTRKRDDDVDTLGEWIFKLLLHKVVWVEFDRPGAINR